MLLFTIYTGAEFEADQSPIHPATAEDAAKRFLYVLGNEFEGATLTHGLGTYTGATGALTTERCLKFEVLVDVKSEDHAKDTRRTVRTLAGQLRRDLGQESVLVTETYVEAHFVY